MSAANAPNPDPVSAHNEREWLASRLAAAPPSSIPHYHAPHQSHRAARRVVGFAVALLIFAGVVGGGLYYLKKHPIAIEQEATRVLPRSGESPSAYSYVATREGRSRTHRGTSIAPSAPQAGTVTVANAGFALSTDEFIAEVIDGDHHYFIRFHRVAPVVVATKNPSTVAAPAPPPGSSGETIYLSRNGWWNLTRSAQPAIPPSNVVAATVVLDVFLTPDGRVDRAQVVSGPAEMATAAVEAVKNWHYDAPGAGAPAQRRVVVNFSVLPQ